MTPGDLALLATETIPPDSVIVCTRLPARLNELAQAEAKRRGINRSRLMRQALAEWIIENTDTAAEPETAA